MALFVSLTTLLFSHMDLFFSTFHVYVENFISYLINKASDVKPLVENHKKSLLSSIEDKNTKMANNSNEKSAFQSLRDKYKNVEVNKEDTPLYKNPWFYIGIIGVAVVIGGVYYYFYYNSDDTSGGTVVPSINNPTNVDVNIISPNVVNVHEHFHAVNSPRSTSEIALEAAATDSALTEKPFGDVGSSSSSPYYDPLAAIAAKDPSVDELLPIRRDIDPSTSRSTTPTSKP